MRFSSTPSSSPCESGQSVRALDEIALHDGGRDRAARVWQGRIRYFAYAVYRMSGVPLQKVFQDYRRRFRIESGYRQSQQVRARTASRHPGLRLLFFGLSLMLVNLWVLCSQICAITNLYGRRFRLFDLTLASLAHSLASAIETRYGIREIEQAMPVAKVT